MGLTRIGAHGLRDDAELVVGQSLDAGPRPRVPPPFVSAIAQQYTRTQGGGLITISGAGFSNATSVRIGGTLSPFFGADDDGNLSFVTPAKPPGVYAVRVFGPGGGSNTNVSIEFVDPRSIFGASLRRWYSASYAPGVWSDLSGGRDATQATSSKRPLPAALAGGHYALRFDGVDDGLNAGGDVELFTTAGTVAAIFDTSTAYGGSGAKASVLSKASAANAWNLGARTAVPAGKFGFGVNDDTDAKFAISNATINDGANRRAIAVFRGHATAPTNSLYIDGALQTDVGAAGASVLDTADFVAIGCGMTSESTTDLHWKGKIAEVVIANVAASTAQRERLDAYLADCQYTVTVLVAPQLGSPTAYYSAPNYVPSGTPTWKATRGSDLVAVSTPSASAVGGAPSFDTTTAELRGTDPFATWSNERERHLFVRVTTTGLASWGTNNDARNTNPSPLNDSNNLFGLYFYRSSADGRFYVDFYDWDGAAKYARVDVTSQVDANGAGTFCVQGRKLPNGTLQGRASHISWVTGATGVGATTASPTQSFLQVGKGFKGIVHAAATWNVALGENVGLWLELFFDGATAPSVSEISPDLGDIHGDTPVTLRVKGAVTGVSIGGMPCSSVSQSGATVTCTAPALPPGMHDVIVAGPGGTSAALAGAYEAWHPTVAYPAARVFQSDRGITAASSAARHRTGRIASPLRNGYIPRDGAALVRLANGRLLLLGGAAGTAQTAWGGLVNTNEVLYSDDEGRSWELLLEHVSAPPTSGTTARFLPGHSAGVFMHSDEGVEYVYWIGSDANAGAGRDGGVWRSTNGETWTRISTTAPTAGKSLFMTASYGGAIYVMGGQTTLSDPATALQTVHRSTDGGLTWSQLSDAPWAKRGGVYNPVVYRDELYLAGGATHADTQAARTYYNDVWKFNGASWTQLRADGHAQWTRRHYHSLLVHDSKLWILNGYDGATGNRADAYFSTDGANWQAASSLPSWAATREQAAISLPDGIFVTNGDGLWELATDTGALASAWADQGSGSLVLAQATDASKPVVKAAAFGALPGVVTSGTQSMSLAAIDRGIATGVYEAWVIGKTLNTDATAVYPAINPPCTLVGNRDDSTFNEFGLDGDKLEYHDGSLGWRTAEGGAGLCDDRCRLLGVEHRAGVVKLFAGSTQQGPTATTLGFHTTYTGWNNIGAGYLGQDCGQFVFGAVVVLKTDAPSSQVFRTKLNKWAKKWGSIS